MPTNAIAQPAPQQRLFAQRDFVLEGEDEEHAQTFSELMAELAPGSILEQTFATEIMGAHWRLRRCGILEFDLARSADPQIAIEQSIDRARTQSHNILRRSLAELRKLQTERHTRILVSGATDSSQAVKTAGSSFCKPAQAAPATPPKPTGSSFCKPPQSAPATPAKPTTSSFCNPPQSTPATPEKPTTSSFCKPPQSAPATPAKPTTSSFCKTPAATPRNAPCPCGSGAKYNRCCGKNAPPVLNLAA